MIKRYVTEGHRIYDTVSGIKFAVYDTPISVGSEKPDKVLGEVLAELLNKYETIRKGSN